MDKNCHINSGIWQFLLTLGMFPVHRTNQFIFNWRCLTIQMFCFPNFIFVTQIRIIFVSLPISIYFYKFIGTVSKHKMPTYAHSSRITPLRLSPLVLLAFTTEMIWGIFNDSPPMMTLVLKILQNISTPLDKVMLITSL